MKLFYNNNSNNKVIMIFYTLHFFYCYRHDDGIVIQSTEYPDPNLLVCSGCQNCNYVNKGVLKYSNNIFTEIESLFTNYSIYGGGYELEYFTQNIKDKNGDRIEIQELEDYITLIKKN